MDDVAREMMTAKWSGGKQVDDETLHRSQLWIPQQIDRDGDCGCIETKERQPWSGMTRNYVNKSC